MNDGSDGQFEFRVPLSEIYKFNEPEKAKDLVDAHKEGPPKRSEMHPASRLIISTVGLFFLMGGLTGAFSKNSGLLPLIWLVLGFVIIWFFLVKPEIAKKKLKFSAEQQKEVSLVLNEDGITVKSRFYELKREWPELLEYKRTKKGIHLYFIDGVVNWLPADAFYEQDEMKAFVGLLRKKLPEQREA